MKTLIINIREVVFESIKLLTGEMESVETLICDVTILDETRNLHFHYQRHSDLFRNSSDKVYVQIPQYGTDRAHAINLNNTYFNKVREAYLYIQKINNEYKLIVKYRILKGYAVIISWSDNVEQANKFGKAIDNQIPSPLKYS